MANQVDNWIANEGDRKRIADRVDAILSGRGVDPRTVSESKRSRIVENVVSQGAGYFDTIRANPTRYQDQGGPGSPGAPQAGDERTPPGMSEGRDAPGGGAESGMPAEPQVNYRDLAAGRFPWLTPRLLDLFADFWADTGDPNAALGKLRDTSEHARVFPGIKRDDGSLRMSEGEYFSEKSGFREALSEFGFNPGQYEKQFVSLFENEVDARELYGAVQEAVNRFTEPGQERSGLADQFVQNFIGSGSAQEALRTVRNSSEYDKLFAGNRREDGSLRMDEPEYFAYKRGWQRTLAGFGLNPQEFEARGRFRASVEGELSIDEVGGRLQAVQDGIIDNIDAVQQFYADNYGLELNASSILGMAIDPAVQRDVLERKITAGQIGGEAAVRGFARSVERAEELAKAGVGQQRARELYGQAEVRLPGLSATTRRFHRGETGIGEFEEAFGLGDQRQANRLQQAVREEQVSFGSRADTRRSQSGFGLAGLRQR